MRHLLSSGEVASTVVAPVPWFPVEHPMFGRYASFARVPGEERSHGITILHPRYPVIPKLGMSSAPVLMYAALRKFMAMILQTRFPFDLIDAHYFYPDGVAAALLGRSLGKPVVITARGTDVNLIADFRLPRRWIRWAAARAAGIVTVSEALRERLLELGLRGSPIEVLRNGVDLELFAPQDRAAARRELGLVQMDLVLSVSALVLIQRPRSRHPCSSAAEEPRLILVGRRVPRKRLCGAWPSSNWVAGRVRFVGSVPAGAAAGRV